MGTQSSPNHTVSTHPLLSGNSVRDDAQMVYKMDGGCSEVWILPLNTIVYWYNRYVTLNKLQHHFKTKQYFEFLQLCTSSSKQWLFISTCTSNEAFQLRLSLPFIMTWVGSKGNPKETQRRPKGYVTRRVCAWERGPDYSLPAMMWPTQISVTLQQKCISCASSRPSNSVELHQVGMYTQKEGGKVWP